MNNKIKTISRRGFGSRKSLKKKKTIKKKKGGC